MKVYLIRYLLIVCFFSVSSSYSSNIFEEARQNVEKTYSESSGSSSDIDIKEANKNLTLAELIHKQLYYLQEIDYRKKAWDFRLRSFYWQFWTSVVIFIFVIIFMLVGLYFSYLQFKASGYGKDEHIDHRTEVKISRSGVELSSPVIGLLILFLSLCFFYLYLKEVYPLQNIQNTFISKTAENRLDNS